ncbi:aspartate kinase [Bacillus mycoides]|uniref:Aspartokinase n=1 Tax=Bacillus mycoides TaxID=1405 RepID=A0A1D3MR74_BACMY|nr:MULTISPECIES: aspartate kinase [Bacillus cereus group]MBJ8070529.1 aspartate kinase [Bacillus cereus]EJV69290.1 aspartate kinase, monofunctional class [Bacillus cereus BAG6O-2]MBJ8189165.1 aspartate kinase [Bacillus cereus]OFD38577.1 aspartate kinase [Bacillus mycoides]OFD39467.1 aspartate kinase [Bacillus mycoides]
MKIIVQKFGGTSVRDDNGRKHALHHIKKSLAAGYKVVTVVSAMGRKGEPYATDTLLSLVNQEESNISKREQDLLLSCGELISAIVFSNMLNENGIKAAALNGAQAGFVTNGDFTNAKIIEMNCDRIHEELANVDVIVVTGFQGQTKNGDTTTLGRGGSDTSASALGVALHAEYIDIFTDVEGVMTADPRIVKDARHLQTVTYNEICNMAYQGAKVVHPRAVEIAMHAKVPLRVRSTYSDSEGTLIAAYDGATKGQDVEERPVTGIAHVSNVTQIKVLAKKTAYDLQQHVFKEMANEGISVDLINISPTGVAYTVKDSVSARAVEVLKQLGYDPVVTEHCAKVSIVGAGMAGIPGVTAKIVTALAEKGIQILQSADSHTTIWVLVKEADLVEAVNALHSAFELSKEKQLEQ